MSALGFSIAGALDPLVPRFIPKAEIARLLERGI